GTQLWAREVKSYTIDSGHIVLVLSVAAAAGIAAAQADRLKSLAAIPKSFAAATALGIAATWPEYPMRLITFAAIAVVALTTLGAPQRFNRAARLVLVFTGGLALMAAVFGAGRSTEWWPWIMVFAAAFLVVARVRVTSMVWIPRLVLVSKCVLSTA